MASTRSIQRQRILKQAAEWFVELQSEQCDIQQRQQFELWLSADPTHRLAYNELQGLWGNLDTLKTRTVPGLKAARSARPRDRHAKTILSTALLVALTGGWWLDYSAPRIDYQTGIGEQRSVHLSDGSQLQLNTATALSVKLSWLRRDIELQHGEALFTVAHQAWRPFQVHADNLNISDIGTVFNVRRDNASTSVAVLEGEVELRQGRSWFGESLKAGFSRQTDQNGRWQAVKPTNAQTATAWTNGKLLFDHTPLAEVVTELERYHAVNFVFADPNVSKQTLSGSFNATDLKPFLQAVQKILPVKIQRQNQNIVFYSQ